MTDAPITVRVATPADLKQIMELAVEAAKENGFLDASTALLLKTIWGPLNQDHGIIGCIGDNPIEGMVVLQIGTLFYSEQQCAEEKVVFVRSEYRAAKGGRARRLCEFSKSVADKLSIPLLIGICSSERTKAKVALYRRFFGEPAGVYFLYGTKTGSHQVVP